MYTLRLPCGVRGVLAGVRAGVLAGVPVFEAARGLFAPPTRVCLRAFAGVLVDDASGSTSLGDCLTAALVPQVGTILRWRLTGSMPASVRRLSSTFTCSSVGAAFIVRTSFFAAFSEARRGPSYCSPCMRKRTKCLSRKAATKTLLTCFGGMASGLNGAMPNLEPKWLRLRQKIPIDQTP